MSLFAIVLLAAAASEPPRLCPDAEARHTVAPERAAPKRLGELPPAQAWLAVLRREDGCIRPQTVREFRDAERR